MIVLFQSNLFSFSPKTNTNRVYLNSKEETWLKSLNRPLRVAITQIPNQVLKDESGYRGYAIDIFNKITSLTGINFVYKYYESWHEVLDAGKKREVDIVFFAQKTAERMKYFNFTDPVMIQHNKIMATSKNFLDVDVDDLKGKRVAVVKGSAIDEYLKLNYPSIIRIHSCSEPESINRLLWGEADYTVAEPIRVGYYIKMNNIDNLYIAGDFPYDYKLRIASRNDIPNINIILNRTIESISPAYKKALSLKWGYEKDTIIDKKLLINIFIIGTIVVLFLIYLSILNRKLKRAKNNLSQMNKTLEKRVQSEVEKNREKELIMLQQSRYAQMGQAISMIAHQWRQPLNNLSVINQTLYLKCKKGTLSESELREFKDKATIQIQQMSKTIDDFRDFFKPRKEKSIFSFSSVIESLLDIVKPIYDKHNIVLESNLKDDMYIDGYSNELAQATLNILYNAKDALVENRDDNRVVNVSMSYKDDFVTLSIYDNAGGIPDDIIEHIFEPYFSTKGKNGTGIGLYMSKIIVQKHMNGELKVKNHKDGVLFEMTFKRVIQSAENQ